MNILVTGAAGFIGSHLCEKLLSDSQHTVVGVDSFIGTTPIKIKQMNLEGVLQHPRFQFIETDLLTANLEQMLDGIDVIYHLAGMPGVRSSWGTNFDQYVTNNIMGTQRLLEAAKDCSLKKFIYASTSSVYGDKKGKIMENAYLSPLSPYGITKLTGEHLCNVYLKSYHIPLITVRLFTVYGPRQRPDMAFHKFISQILKKEPITIYGDGTQSRDFTYIDDCIEGIFMILNHDHLIGETINIGGKERATVNEVVSCIEQLMGEKAIIHYSQNSRGEPKHTWADSSKAQRLLNYHPRITLKEGLVKEIEYIRFVQQVNTE